VNTTPLDFAQAVVVGGAGEVGRLFLSLLTAHAERRLIVVDPKAGGSSFAGHDTIHEDVRRPGGELLRRLQAADLVVLATPESVALDCLPLLAKQLKSTCLLVDTLSVKSRIAQALDGTALQCEALGLNPMFAPSLGFSGQSTIATRYRQGPRSKRLLGLIAAQGCRLTEMTAEEHDCCTAALQVATHAAVLSFGLSLARTGYDLATCEQIMPPPHRTMLALLARILKADPEVYWDIQAGNPRAETIRSQLIAAAVHLQETVKADDTSGFRADLASLRQLFGEGRSRYEALCEDLFKLIKAP
jgi:prephenate dehydrogenase